MITSSPCCQLAGVATWYFAVSCSESTAQNLIEMRPVVIGYGIISWIFLSGRGSSVYSGDRMSNARKFTRQVRERRWRRHLCQLLRTPSISA